MMGMEKPDYQIKKASGKKSIAPMFIRNKDEQLHGVGMLVVAGQEKNYDPYSAFNAQTLSRYNGRKRQFNEYHSKINVNSKGTEPSTRSREDSNDGRKYRTEAPGSQALQEMQQRVQSSAAVEPKNMVENKQNFHYEKRPLQSIYETQNALPSIQKPEAPEPAKLPPSSRTLNQEELIANGMVRGLNA